MKYTVEVDLEKNIRWYKEGTKILHREDGPAVEIAGGTKYWYQNDKLHREDGPAIEDAGGTKYWYQNDKRHREDGPAIEDVNGYKAWFWLGKEVSEEEHKKLSGNSPSCDGKIVNIDGKNYKLVEVLNPI